MRKLQELGFRPDVFSPYYKHLKKSDVGYFHQNKVKVIPWTVNTTEEMIQVKAMGVDGIITDYPNRIPKL